MRAKILLELKITMQFSLPGKPIPNQMIFCRKEQDFGDMEAIMNKATLQKLCTACVAVPVMTLAGCASGPYAPNELKPVLQPVATNQPAPGATDDDQKEKRNTKPAPEPVSVNLSISPRDPEQAIDLSVEGPLVIPREVFE